MNLQQVADEIARRLVGLFLPDSQGRRPCHGQDLRYASDPHWKELILFYEYFHAETGRGCGANHQTGWTGNRCGVDACSSKAVSETSGLPLAQSVFGIFLNSEYRKLERFQ